MYDILYMQNLKRNELVYKTETDSEDELMVVRGEESGKGIVKEFGIDTYSLLYLKWITNKDLCIADGTLLNAVWQSGWEGFWENGYMCMCV